MAIVEYPALLASLFVGMALVIVGDILFVGLMVWSGIHLARQRPRWYLVKILKGAAVGGLAGLALSSVFILGSAGQIQRADLVYFAHLVLSGLGWGALAPARWYSPHRFEAHGQPI